MTFINTAAPWASDNARNALDMIMMAVSLDQEVQVIFCDDGVYQLLGQHAQALESKNPLVKYRVLSDIFELDSLYVLDDALTQRHLEVEQLSLSAQVVDAATMRNLLQQSDQVVRF